MPDPDQLIGLALAAEPVKPRTCTVEASPTIASERQKVAEMPR